MPAEDMTPEGAFDESFDDSFEIALALSDTDNDAGEFDDSFDDSFAIGHRAEFDESFDESFAIGLQRGYRILDIAVIRDDLFVLIQSGSTCRLERLSIPPEAADIREGSWFSDQISSLDYNDYTAITDGAFKISIDGVESVVDQCDFSLALTNADIAAELQARIRTVFGGSPTVRIHQGDRIVITSGLTDLDSEVTAPTSAGKGTDLATAALLGTPGDAYDAQMPFAVKIDSRLEVTGVYNESTGYTTWDHALDDPTMDEVVLGRGWGAQAGSVLTNTEKVTSNKLRALGDYSGAAAYIGRSFKMRLQLSRPYIRDSQGDAVLDVRTHVRQLIANHQRAGAYQFDVTNPDRSVRSSEFKPLEVGVASIGSFAIDDVGTHKTIVMANADNVTIDIVSTSPLPVTIASLEWIAEVARRSP